MLAYACTEEVQLVTYCSFGPGLQDLQIAGKPRQPRRRIEAFCRLTEPSRPRLLAGLLQLPEELFGQAAVAPAHGLQMRHSWQTHDFFHTSFCWAGPPNKFVRNRTSQLESCA